MTTIKNKFYLHITICIIALTASVFIHGFMDAEDIYLGSIWVRIGVAVLDLITFFTFGWANYYMGMRENKEFKITIKGSALKMFPDKSYSGWERLTPDVMDDDNLPEY